MNRVNGVCKLLCDVAFVESWMHTLSHEIMITQTSFPLPRSFYFFFAFLILSLYPLQQKLFVIKFRSVEHVH